MYLEIDEGYFEHPKTLDLCARLGDSKASIYPLRLWKWACRSAKTGRLGKISAFAVEKAIDYEPMDGKAFASMVEAGWIDKGQDGSYQIHDWMSYTGGAILRMDKKAEENRARRAEAKKRHDAEKNQEQSASVPESYQNRTSTNPSQTRQDKTSPDQTSLKRGEAPAKVRPETPHDLILCIKIAVEARPNAKMWAAEPLAYKNAEEFLRYIGDVQKALPDIERRIAIFAADPDMQPWTVKKFCTQYNGIGLPKLEYGKAPKKSDVPPQTPVIE
jgi:FtsZ-interacting cell division protein YlmF